MSRDGELLAGFVKGKINLKTKGHGSQRRHQNQLVEEK